MSSQFNTSDPITSRSNILGLTVNQQLNGTPQIARDQVTIGTNGITATVNNSVSTVHSYTINSDGFILGNRLTYIANFSCSSTSPSIFNALYECGFTTSAGSFSFGTESIPVFSLAGTNNIGIITANFRVINNASTNQLLCDYSIRLYNPASPNATTYENNSFINIPYNIFISSFTVFSAIASPNTFVTTNILASEFFGVV